MKNKLVNNFFIFLLLLLVSFDAKSEHFKCDLSLNLIENSSSTQTIRLLFDVEVRPDSKNTMSGTMITRSCFNTIPEPFNSDFLDFKQETMSDLMRGTFHAPNLSIGNYTVYHYQLNLNFILAKNETDENDNAIIHFLATGKMLPLDNEHFIHQNVSGECWLSIDKVF